MERDRRSAVLIPPTSGVQLPVQILEPAVTWRRCRRTDFGGRLIASVTDADGNAMGLLQVS